MYPLPPTINKEIVNEKIISWLYEAEKIYRAIILIQGVLQKSISNQGGLSTKEIQMNRYNTIYWPNHS